MKFNTAKWKGIWERNAFYILLGVCVLTMGIVAWTSRGQNNTTPDAPRVQQENPAATPFDDYEMKRGVRFIKGDPLPEGEDGKEADGQEANGTGTKETPDGNTPAGKDAVQDDTPVSDTPSETPVPVQAPPVTEKTPEKDAGEAAGQALDEPAEDTVAAAARPTLWQCPMAGDVIVSYAADQLIYWETLGAWRVHAAIDIKPESDPSVFAVADGTVTLVTEDTLLGYTVVIDHGEGITGCYASLTADVLVEAGDKVRAGQPIGTAGTSRSEKGAGTHLHFAISRDGVSCDPLSYISAP